MAGEANKGKVSTDFALIAVRRLSSFRKLIACLDQHAVYAVGKVFVATEVPDEFM